MNVIYAIMGEDEQGNYGIVAISLGEQIMPCVSCKVELINELMRRVKEGKRGSGCVFETVRFTRDMVIERIKT